MRASHDTLTHFRRLAQALPVAPLVQALTAQPELWNTERLRTTHPGTVHREVDDIWLRFTDLTALYATGNPAEVMDVCAVRDYPARACLPEVEPLLTAVSQRLGLARVGRVLITHLPPGAKIGLHRDEGTYAAHHTRVHVLLQGDAWQVFHAGDDAVSMAPGDAWWFDTAQRHAVYNHGQVSRLTLILDFHPDEVSCAS